MRLEFTGESLDEFAGHIAALVLSRLPEPEPLSPYLTTAEAAEFLRCSRQRVHDLISSRRLSRHKEGGRTLVLRSEIEGLVRREP